jgi:hypothetical protein
VEECRPRHPHLQASQGRIRTPSMSRLGILRGTTMKAKWPLGPLVAIGAALALANPSGSRSQQTCAA